MRSTAHAALISAHRLTTATPPLGGDRHRPDQDRREHDEILGVGVRRSQQGEDRRGDQRPIEAVGVASSQVTEPPGDDARRGGAGRARSPR